MRYTVNLDCKTHHVSKDGTVPILLRVSINGVHDYFNTGRRIKATHYDKETKSLKSGITGHSSLDAFITRQKGKINDIISEFERRNEVATLYKVKELYDKKTGNVKSDSFYEYVEETIAWEKENTAIAKGTFVYYEKQIIKLKKYRAKLTIHDIDKTFLEEYKAYILRNLGQAKNTAYHAMCFLRKYTKKLFDDGKINPYPFAKFQVGSPFEVEPDYLEPEELTALHNLYESGELLKEVRIAKSKYTRYKEFNVGERWQNVMQYFLVACYTGLRHSDIKSLCRADIKGKFIVKEMQKGREGRKKTVRIPIRKRLVSLLDTNTKSGLLFPTPVMHTEQTNKYLKKIMEKAGIDKHITFHCARHSFAIISLLLGIKIEVVSDILGHSELTTTQRYARVVDTLREQEMDKWDKMVQDELKSNENEINCPECENTVMKFEKAVIKLNRIPCVCPYCSVSFTYDLKENKSVLISKTGEYSSMIMKERQN